MSLKAVLLDFRGVIINDEAIHQELISDILLNENLRPDSADYQQYCQRKSDRVGLRSLMASRGRMLSEDYLDKLIENKTKAYRQKITALETLPIYSHLKEFFTSLKEKNLLIGLTATALRSEVELILQLAELSSYFDVVVGSEDVESSQENGDGYQVAIALLNQKNADLNLTPQECLAIEDSPAGIEAAKATGIQVVGIANTYPLHMLQRQANWTVDNLAEIELDRVDRILQQFSEV